MKTLFVSIFLIFLSTASFASQDINCKAWLTYKNKDRIEAAMALTPQQSNNLIVYMATIDNFDFAVIDYRDNGGGLSGIVLQKTSSEPNNDHIMGDLSVGSASHLTWTTSAFDAEIFCK